jgi:hypothetical protein
MADSLVVTARQDHRHAACGYTLGRARVLGFTRAFCGAGMEVPPPPPSPGQPKCTVCLDAARRHGTECDCFKMWTQKGARLP